MRYEYIYGLEKDRISDVSGTHNNMGTQDAARSDLWIEMKLSEISGSHNNMGTQDTGVFNLLYVRKWLFISGTFGIRVLSVPEME